MVRNDIFPILDVSCLSDNYTAASDWEGAKLQHDVQVNNLVEELSNGFSDWGFLYVKGHGIPQNLIDGTFKMSEKFFRMEKETKMSYKRGPGISEGYVPIKGEVFDEMKPEDIKEAFDFLPNSDVSKKLSQEMPEVVTELSELFEHCSTLLYKLLRLLAVALGIDTETFVNLHTNIGNRSLNGTSLRTLFYPHINRPTAENQRRCGEHTDYGFVSVWRICKGCSNSWYHRYQCSRSLAYMEQWKIPRNHSQSTNTNRSNAIVNATSINCVLCPSKL
ncbi:uncharacterized protein LOC130636361 isoform X2 [Hydractinia symbiolongicarpus]|uniref:uncharacterized protein LOC130636361 isoform X2 n=1 Tax=Hydractinia symbiolongicarpus TaxID=13093 RepID=UPI00254C2798|nr:uncharacterized protein LOC130636361 isoform X2 [Hydractinia symbiolongicarpus]